MVGFKHSPVLLQEINRTFRFGYFFESVYYVLEKKEKDKDLIQEDKAILTTAIEFLKKVQKGESDVKTGLLGSSTIESIGAYRRSLYVFFIKTKREQFNKFDAYIQHLIESLNTLEKTGQLKTSELNQLKTFFGGLNVENFKESESILESAHQRRGPIEWIAI